MNDMGTQEARDYYHDMFKWGKQRRSQGNTEAIWTFEGYNRNVNGELLIIPNTTSMATGLS